MVDSTEHDDLLFSMLKECKTLPVFLNHIFGFLSRRTDFYHVAPEPNSPVGLPPGLAEQIVKQTFHKWKTQKFPPPDTDKPKKSETSALVQKSQENAQKFSSSDCYNGAIFDNYTWSQTLTEVDVIIKIPDNTTTKDLNIKITTDELSVKLKDDTVLLEGELCEKCKQKEAIWSLNGAKLEIHLDKCKEIWWNCLIKSEPKLDINTLDCSRPFEELPEEAQAKIEELQWNQERKRLGLPTSDELAMHSILKQSWNCEGSPFSGPFDPSTVKFN